LPYSIIQPPFSFDFKTMPKPELKAYFAWFMQVMPERIAGLEAAVQASAPSWRADESPDSLVGLGEWFDGQVEERARSEEEVEEVKAGLSFPIEVPGQELTNRTFSLAMDIGMYFGRVVLAGVPGTRWDQSLKNARLADHGQPVVAGAGAVPLNPVRIAVTLAYGIADRSQRGGPRLRELYDVWRRMLGPGA